MSVDNVPENGIDSVVVTSGEASVAARTGLSDRKVTHIRTNPEIATELTFNVIRFDPIVFLEYMMKFPFVGDRIKKFQRWLNRHYDHHSA